MMSQHHFQLPLWQALEMKSPKRWIFNAVITRYGKQRYRPFGRDIMGSLGPEKEDPAQYLAQRLTGPILKSVRNKKEAQIAIELAFQHIGSTQVMEGDGDHHSMAYGEEVPVYYHVLDDAIIFAQNTDELRSQLKTSKIR